MSPKWPKGIPFGFLLCIQKDNWGSQRPPPKHSGSTDWLKCKPEHKTKSRVKSTHPSAIFQQSLNPFSNE